MAILNQEAAVFGSVPQKISLDDGITKAESVHSSEFMVAQSRDDYVRDVGEEEARVVELSESSGDSGGTYQWDSVIKQITADPSLAMVEREGVLPLHAACDAGAPIHVIKMLLEIYPEAAQAKTDNGYLPLFCHLLLNTESPSEDIVAALLESYPEAAAVVDDNDQLPIHLACMATGVSKNIFTMLLRAYPRGAYVCDIEGFYPVDYAAGNKDAATRKVALSSLIANDPEEFRGHYIEKDETGEVTMTDADVDLLVNGPTLETRSELVNLTDDIIHDILTSFTLSEETKEAPYLMRATSEELASVCHVVDEKSLLHHLEQCIEHGSSPSQAIVTTLIESYPTSARVANSSKQLPIHLACKATGVYDSIFTMLLRAYRQGAYVRDANGMCPIDYAVSNKDLAARKSAIAALVQNDSQVDLDATSSPTIIADTSPQHTISEGNELAAASSAPIIPLEETDTPAEKSLLHHLEHCLEHNLSPSKDIVSKIIECYPSSVRVANAKNQLPIHLACMAADIPETILTLLLIVYPEGAYVCDDTGLYPIDYAAGNKDVTTRKTAIAALVQNDAVVKFMRAQSAPTIPRSAPVMSEENEQVGLCACGGGMMDITEEEDDSISSATEEDEANANALREILACNSSPPEAIVLSAIESHPGATRVLDANGQLPIHHACKAKRVSENTFAYILGAYPEGAYVPDKFGKYPIDYAAENKDTETRMNAIAALLQNDAAKGLARKRA